MDAPLVDELENHKQSHSRDNQNKNYQDNSLVTSINVRSQELSNSNSNSLSKSKGPKARFIRVNYKPTLISNRRDKVLSVDIPPVKRFRQGLHCCFQFFSDWGWLGCLAANKVEQSLWILGAHIHLIR